MSEIIAISLIVLGVSLILAYWWFRRIRNNFVGLVTIFGARVYWLLGEGYKLFPGYPWLSGYIEVDARKKDIEFAVKVRTPDGTEFELPILITARANSSSASAIMIFLNSGAFGDGEDVAKDPKTGKWLGAFGILENMVAERTRQWAGSTEEGPQVWEDAQKASQGAVEIILEMLIGRNIEKEELKAAERNDGNFEIKPLGLAVDRLNIGQPVLPKEVSDAANKMATEEAERKAETVEQDFLVDRIKKLTAEGIDPAEAARRLSIERGKSTEIVISGNGANPILLGSIPELTKTRKEKN